MHIRTLLVWKVEKADMHNMAAWDPSLSRQEELFKKSQHSHLQVLLDKLLHEGRGRGSGQGVGGDVEDGLLALLGATHVLL